MDDDVVALETSDALTDTPELVGSSSSWALSHTWCTLLFLFDMMGKVNRNQPRYKEEMSWPIMAAAQVWFIFGNNFHILEGVSFISSNNYRQVQTLWECPVIKTLRNETGSVTQRWTGFGFAKRNNFSSSKKLKVLSDLISESKQVSFFQCMKTTGLNCAISPDTNALDDNRT